MRGQTFLDAKKIVAERYPNCDAALLAGVLYVEKALIRLI